MTNTFHNIDLKYGRTTLRLIRRHERRSCKLARYANHLTFLIRCVRNHVVPRVAELASLRLLKERIRLAQRAKGNEMKDSHSTAKSITATLSPKDASEILEKSVLNKDPTDRLSRKFTEKPLNLKRGGHLTESVYNKIKPKHKQPPRIYGLPKISPLRSIVSCVDTFAYDLSSYLADVLSPLTGKSEYTVNNSAHFVSTINGERVLESDF